MLYPSCVIEKENATAEWASAILSVVQVNTARNYDEFSWKKNEKKIFCQYKWNVNFRNNNCMVYMINFNRTYK